MKDFFIYLSGCLYSVIECLKTWKKPKRYPIIIFIISFIMLLTPIQSNMLSTPTESLINQIPNIQVVLKDLAIELNSQNIQVSIENNKLNTTSKYETVINNYYIYIGIDLEEYPLINSNEVSDKDSFIMFGENRFYARYTSRTELNTLEGANTLSGYYNKLNNFDFNSIYEVKDNDSELNNLVGSFLKMIYLSNSGFNTIIWVFIIEMINLLYLLLGTFILLFTNKKGNRDYRLTYGQGFLTLMGSLIFPSLISSIIGVINFRWFMITYVLLAFIRLFMLCLAQISRNDKYNQIENKIKDEDFELNFK